MRMSDWSSDVCSSDLWPSTSSTFFLQALVGVYKKKVEEVLGHPFPQDVNDQLWGAVGAVFGSWQSERAKVYRRIHDIDRKSVVVGQRVSVRVYPGGRRILKTQTTTKPYSNHRH